MTHPPQRSKTRLRQGPFMVSRKDRLAALSLGLLVLAYALISMPRGLPATYLARTDSMENRPLNRYRSIPGRNRSITERKASESEMRKAAGPATHNDPGYEMRKRSGYEYHKTSSYGAGPHTPITQRSPYGRPFEKPRLKNRTPLSLNGSDSAALEMLPGIGPVLAARIIRYREKLGGFYQRSQLREVYGIDDSLLAFIAPFFETSPSASALKKIDLNSVSLDNLRQHPYLRWEKAKAIVRYRESNGPFTSVSDLEKIIALDTTTLSRLLPYVVVKATTLSTN